MDARSNSDGVEKKERGWGERWATGTEPGYSIRGGQLASRKMYIILSSQV